MASNIKGSIDLFPSFLPRASNIDIFYFSPKESTKVIKVIFEISTRH